MNTDVVIIGAGIIGSSIALELARAGYTVTVVDKADSPGRGSTSASSAIVRFNFSTWAGVATAWEAKFSWERWNEHLNAGPEETLARFVRSGIAMLDADIAPRSVYLPHFSRAGIPHEEWSPAELAARIPGIDTGRYWPPRRVEDPRFWDEPSGDLGAVFTPDAGFVSDPQLAAVNLANAAARNGARFLLNKTVIAVDQRDGRVAGARLSDGTAIAAPVVVNAAGPWSGKVNALALSKDTDDFTITGTAAAPGSASRSCAPQR